MPAPLTFRHGSADDHIGLVALQWRASLGNPRDRELLTAEPSAIGFDSLVPGRCVIASMNGADVGFAIVLPSDDGAATLEGLSVDPSYWTLGIGRALCGEARKLARAMGADALRVTATPPSIDFCRSLGFRPAGETPLMVLAV